MHLKNAIKQNEAFQYVMIQLNIQSGLGKRRLLEWEWMTDSVLISKTLQEIEQTRNFLEKPEFHEVFASIYRKLSQVKDIKSPLVNLKKGMILNDIELFEIKNFCLLCLNINDLLSGANIDMIPLANVKPALDILDPEHQRLPNFYIYDSYSDELKVLRIKIKEERNALEALPDKFSEAYKTQEAFAEQLYFQSVAVEDVVRADLASHLIEHVEDLFAALEDVARLDILLAKATQAQKMQFCKPTVSEQETRYHALFNPQVKNILAEKGNNFQAIDIQLTKKPCLITGANMSGKTVLLKTLHLSQLLFQFGFFIPASEAQICIVDAVLYYIDDEQTALKGLSSFAAEILHVNEMITFVKSGKRALILIDELARATNPIEGMAIVNGMLDFLDENKAQSVITTHYTGITAPCRKLRVKGFIEKNISEAITPENINNHIDYSLEEDLTEHVPMEALRVAEILGVDETFLQKTKQYLKKEG